MYIRFGKYSKSGKSLNFTKIKPDHRRDIWEELEFDPNQDIIDIIERYKRLFPNEWTYSLNEIFESGISCFEMSGGLPVLSNIKLYIALAIRLDDPIYILEGDQIGKGQDQEPIISNIRKSEEIAIDKDILINHIISTLKEAFKSCEGSLNISKCDSILKFDNEYMYCGLTFTGPKEGFIV